jgi:uracil-DNA glycosylase
VRFAVEKLDQDAAYQSTLELRLGAQVMLLTNTDINAGLVNGSRGVIVGFNKYPLVKFKRGEPRLIEPFTWFSHEMPHVGRNQIPLRIAYAITIHKSQGASIDSAIVDIGKSTFEYGQAYVALSRVRSLEGLHVFALDLTRIRTHPRVLEFYKGLTVKQNVVDQNAVDQNVADQPVSNFWPLACVHQSWHKVLHKALNSTEGRSLESFLQSSKRMYPTRDNIFRCLSISLDSVKVVILGQDPYHGPGQAMGLSFSVPEDVKAPPSLKNILKEVSSDLGVACSHGNLTSWFNQGVLLLNTILTVEDGKPLSHAKKGWESITDEIIKAVVSETKGCVFMLWGKQAQNKATLINGDHTILEAAHPSPLSADGGFFGCKHFSKANAILGPRAIKWA